MPWPPGLLRSYQLGRQTRRPNNNAAPQRHQIRTGVGGPIVLSMDESAGTHAFEIVVGMAQEGLRAIRFQQRSYKRCNREARQPIKRASLGTERF
jgi:hypothetical protein